MINTNQLRRDAMRLSPLLAAFTFLACGDLGPDPEFSASSETTTAALEMQPSDWALPPEPIAPPLPDESEVPQPADLASTPDADSNEVPQFSCRTGEPDPPTRADAEQPALPDDTIRYDEPDPDITYRADVSVLPDPVPDELRRRVEAAQIPVQLAGIDDHDERAGAKLERLLALEHAFYREYDPEALGLSAE